MGSPFTDATHRSYRTQVTFLHGFLWALLEIAVSASFLDPSFVSSLRPQV